MVIKSLSNNLEWMAFALGDYAEDFQSPAEKYSYDEALEAVENVNDMELLGFSDWRLPTWAELVTLIDKNYTYPLINQNLFPSTPPDFFWTSTFHHAGSENVRCVDFGYFSYHDYFFKDEESHYVRLCRDAKP